jgi:hypothetical protein
MRMRAIFIGKTSCGFVSGKPYIQDVEEIFYVYMIKAIRITGVLILT